MMLSFRTVALSQLVRLGFIVVLCIATALSDPIPGDATTSVATSLGSSQLVASGSDRDEGLGPVKPSSLEARENKNTEEPGSVPSVSPSHIASEVGDLMRDPYHNITFSITDRDEEAMINNETDIIYDPHVNRINKTHEEEGEITGASSSEVPLDRSTQQSPESSVQESSASPATERSTGKAEVTEREAKEYSEKKSEDANPPKKVTGGSVSLAEVTSLPVSALASQHEEHDHSAISKTASLNYTTHVAAILAGVLVLVSIMGYLGLMLWRRVLEKRYGNREMLVNEDDDFKHFEL